MPRASPTRDAERTLPPPLPARGWALAALATLILSLTVFKMSNNDIWIHLKTGENILKTWEVPQKDPYSFTASDHDYVAHEWLSGVLFYLVYAAGGVNGLIFFKAAIIMATCVALYATCRMLKVPRPVLYPCFTLMLFIGSARFLERPHIFSYLFEALYLMCYFGYRVGGRRKGWLVAIPILHVLWTNLHGGHFQGVMLLIMLAVAEVVMYLRNRWWGLAAIDALPARDVVMVCALWLACLVAAFVNPYGYRLLTFPFELTGQEVFMKGIYEWQSALFPSYNVSSMFLYYCFWTVILFGTFLLVRDHRELRGGWREAAWAVNLLLGALWVIFAFEFFAAYKATGNAYPTVVQRHAGLWYVTIGLFLLGNTHRLEFHHAGIVALFFALSMRHNRAVTDAAVAMLPTLGHNLDLSLSRLGKRLRLFVPEPLALVVQGALMLGLALFTYSQSYNFSFNPASKREMGLGIAGNMPVGAVNYIERNEITGRCFPSYNAAAILINRMWPRVTVAMDSRNDVYGERLYNEYTRALAGGPALEAYIRDWQIDFFLITYGSDRSPAFFRFLDTSPDWRLVYFDDRSVVYLRNLPRFEPIIGRDAYRLISPARAEPAEMRVADAPQWLAEAERAVAAAPDALTPRHYKSKALLALGRLDDAEAAARQTLELSADAFFAWGDLGIIQSIKGRNDLAAESFRQCLRIRPDFAPCRENLARLQAPR